jgi:hypothetical protein
MMTATASHHPPAGLLAAALLAGSDAEGMYANSGGPMSRSRSEKIRSTLLGARSGPIRCPRTIRLGLSFGTSDPLLVMSALLEARGLSAPEELRALFPDVPGPMLCAPDAKLTPLDVESADPLLVLRQAFLLGLCTAVFFDPSRPVIWTRASLTRTLSLFDTAGFYA